MHKLHIVVAVVVDAWRHWIAVLSLLIDWTYGLDEASDELHFGGSRHRMASETSSSRLARDVFFEIGRGDSGCQVGELGVSRQVGELGVLK